MSKSSGSSRRRRGTNIVYREVSSPMAARRRRERCLIPTALAVCLIGFRADLEEAEVAVEGPEEAEGEGASEEAEGDSRRIP